MQSERWHRTAGLWLSLLLGIGQLLGLPGHRWSSVTVRGAEQPFAPQRANAPQPQSPPPFGRPGRRLGRMRQYRRDNEQVRSAFQEVVQRARQSTVAVLGDGKRVALGTAVDAQGHVLTKASQLKGQLSVQLADGRHLAAQLVATDSATDLALLKIQARNLPPIRWRTSSPPSVGSLVAAAGLTPTPISVGVVSVGPRAIPAPKGLLGVLLAEDEQGPRIEHVLPDSSAEKAGLEAGDIVLKLNGQPINSREELIDKIHQMTAGTRVQLLIKRGNKQRTLEAVLGSRQLLDPAEQRADLQNGLGGPVSARRAGFPKAIQHDCVLRPEQCGGPLVDLDGLAVGINIARAGRVSTLALPADLVQPLVARLKAGKLVHALSSEHAKTDAPAKAAKVETPTKVQTPQ